MAKHRLNQTVGFTPSEIARPRPSRDAPAALEAGHRAADVAVPSAEQFLTGPARARFHTGFTLIEITIVLAIAALMMLIVFLTVGAAQASRRDTQRHSDAAKLVAAALKYESNSIGAFPPQSTAFVVSYLPNFNDPSSGTLYTVTYTTNVPTAIGEISYHDSVYCAGNGQMTTTGVPYAFAVSIYLERGGPFCLDSQ